MLDKSVFCETKVVNDLTCLHIHHPKFFAEICLQGAQLTQFKPANTPPLIWLSPTAEYNTGQGIRGGIPICWPWFGALNKNPDAIKNQTNESDIAHGFVRTLEWTLNTYSESAHQVELSLLITHNSETLKIWPFEFELECHFVLGDSLSVELETRNLSKQKMAFSQALHSYLPTEDIHKTQIHGATNQHYIDSLDNWSLKRQKNNIRITQEVDRIYYGESNYKVISPNQMLSIISNTHSSVIWNPWINKSKRLSQFSAKDYMSMLCIESANALDDHVVLSPNCKHRLKLKLSEF